MEYRALAPRVLCVAVEGAVGDWAAYVGDVPGKNFEKEVTIVAAKGEKLMSRIAEILFPEFSDLEWRA